MGNKTVRYEAESGQLIDYIGGTWAWRNNNPGNLKQGPFSMKNGAIGEAGGFAVFPDYDVGKKALHRLLKIKKYQEQNLSEIFKHYAPKADGNDPENYKKLVTQFTGLSPDKKLSELTDKEFEKVVNAIIRVEGYKEGTIIKINLRKIIDVKEVKGVIVSYLIEEYGWVDKARAIDFANNGIVDAVVVDGKNGRHLRTKPDNTTTNNLSKD
jgi:hypothetical protein